MITLKLPHKTNISVLNSFRKEQSKVIRISYKLAVTGLKEKEIRHELKNKNLSCDSWLIQSGVRKAIAAVKAEKALGNEHTRIFGGKNNFIRRCKGLITKEEFQNNRLENFYSIGEAPRRGNRKIDFNANSITVKPKMGVKVEIEFPKLRNKRQKLYNDLLIAIYEKKIPVTVEISNNFIYLAFDETIIQDTKKRSFRTGNYLGIDVNPSYIGVSYFNAEKRMLDKQLFNFSELTGKKTNHSKLKHEIREVAIAIGKKLQHHQIQYVFIEDLKFKQGSKGKGRNYNRLCINQFLFNEFFRMLSKFTNPIKVNAAYSSTIGNVVNNQFPDPIAASMEIARRGIESRIVKGSKKFYPPMVSKDTLKRLWKNDSVVLEANGWIELHEILKKTGMKYRVPIPDIGMFRKFNSNSSGVLVYT